LAVALGIAPGTATTMVKALSESDLVVYEPYNGVRLTPAGQKLAARVLRRHRLIELFLVQVVGMKWDEVHDDAEQMEHVVSDALIERIDEMLGQASATTGVGLGLSIVELIARAHGGSVSVHSAEGAGSTFTLTLPAASASADATADKPATDDVRPLPKEGTSA
jgi:signal transduction histidine kinase